MRTVSLQELSPYSGEQLIEQCYSKILLRQPDPDGRLHYQKMLSSGKHKLSVVRSIAMSQEAKKLGVRVPGLWRVTLRDTVMSVPVLGAICAAAQMMFNARSILRDVNAARELASYNLGRIQTAESSLEKQRDLDPIFNSVASTHHHMREVERRLVALESKLSDAQVAASHKEVVALNATVSSLAGEVQRVGNEFDSFKNIASSFPATMRDQMTRLATLKRQVGEPGSTEWKESIGGRLERAQSFIESYDARIAKPAADRRPSDAQTTHTKYLDRHEGNARDVADDAAQLRKSIDQIHASLQQVYHRIEFVRKETLQEVRFGAASAYAEKCELISARIINPAKVKAARADGLRLNVGCGHLVLADHINVDRRELHGVDVLAEATQLPFEKGEVAVLRASHLVEHFPQEQLRREVLPHWRTLIRPGGKLHLIVPDAEHMFREYYRGTYPYEHFREALFGEQEYVGNSHHNMFMPTQISMLLHEAGFEAVRWLARGRMNGLRFEMELEAE